MVFPALGAQKCPVSWSGQLMEKEKIMLAVLGAISDVELCIWGCHFGKPGSMDDIKIHDTSPLVLSIIDGHMLPEF